MENGQAEQKTSRLQQGLGSAAALMVFATLGSSITGLAREIVFAHEFGNSLEYNAYLQAFGVPDLFYFLIAGGALRTGFIPVFTQYMAEGRPDKAWRTFSVTFFLLLLFSIVGVTAVVLAAPWVAKLVGLGFTEEQRALCTRMIRTMMPAQVFFIVGGLLMGTLNARRHFATPAAGPITYNLFIIAGALVSLPIARWSGIYEPQDPTAYRLWCVSLFVVLGAAFGSVFIQIPPLLRLGARLQPVFDLRDEGLRRLFALALPIIIGLAVSEIAWFITKIIATKIGADAVSILNYPNRVWKLPPRMFGAGLAMALFPYLSTHFASGKMDEYRRDLARFMRCTLLLSLPSTVICMALATPIMRLLFEAGRFGAADTAATGAVLFWSSFGIAPLSLSYIAARGFYAMHETRTPLWVGVATGLFSIALALAVYRPFGVAGLAAALSASAIFNGVALTWLLRRRVGPLEGRKMLSMLTKVGAASAALGLVCYFGSGAVERWLGPEGFTAKAAICLGPLAVGLVLFFGLCVILRVEDLQTATNLVISRFRKRASSD